MFSSCRSDDRKPWEASWKLPWRQDVLQLPVCRSGRNPVGRIPSSASAGPSRRRGEVEPARSRGAPATDPFQTSFSSFFAPSGDDPFPTMMGTSLFAGGPWTTSATRSSSRARSAAQGARRSAEGSVAHDEALARSLAREEADAALARRLAFEPEGGRPWDPPAPGCVPPCRWEPALAEPFQPPAMPGHAECDADQGMIFVACGIAGAQTEMMVDTGAQMSVISLPMARRLGLMNRLDQSQQGVAAGVGHARIYGKLRRIPIRLGHVEFELDLSVLGVDDDLLMLGIDQMHRFNVIVDLQKRCLVFGGRDGIEVPFMPPRPRVPRLSAGCPQM